jgi:hypothetical protein
MYPYYVIFPLRVVFPGIIHFIHKIQTASDRLKHIFLATFHNAPNIWHHSQQAQRYLVAYSLTNDSCPRKTMFFSQSAHS